MLKIFINNFAVFVPKNSSILDACEKLGQPIPRFCYHSRLNIAGNCRMCLVEIEKSPKPVASCAFPVSPNMKIFTDTPLVKKARENVLEFLLINHPLDCPICDQGGECDLQEQTIAFGSDRNRFYTNKRSVEDKNCGPLIKTVMTRCIHCTRCVRFLQEITGSEEFGTTLRGKTTEIGSYINRFITSELSGNIIDLCPVGALTSKPYTFSARPWEIKSFVTVDISDSVGSLLKVDFKETELLRVLPLSINDFSDNFISDKSRYFIDALKTHRINHCFFRNSANLQKISWKFIHNKILNNESENSTPFKINELSLFFQYHSEEILFVCGNNLDLKTLWEISSISRKTGTDSITENFFEIDFNSLSNFKFNTTFLDVLSSDLCLSVGSNIRYEASLFNVCLKQRANLGGFVKSSIGLSDNLTFSNSSLGNSLRLLIQIIEGSHSFCKILSKSKKPFFVIGSSIKKRLDASSISLLFSFLAKKTNFLQKEWFGFNHLFLTASSFNESFLGINSKTLLNLEKKKFIYCINVENLENMFSKLSKKNRFIIASHSFGNPVLKSANLILPSATFLEQEGDFINLEGHIKTTAKGFPAPGLALENGNILKEILRKDVENKFASSTKKKFFLDPFDNKFSFTKNLILSQRFYIKRITKSPIKLIVPNFFSSNILTKHSLTLVKCSSIFSKNYTNFY